MKCTECGREGLTEHEMGIHKKYFHKHDVGSIQYQQPQKVTAGTCTECGGSLWFQEGCVVCHSCGYSRCG